MNESLSTDLQELHAYVDSELSPEAVRRVEERLAKDSEAALRVVEYRALKREIQSLYRPASDQPVPHRLQHPHRHIGVKSLLSLAAALLLFVGGTWFGWQYRALAPMHDEAVDHVVGEVATAYSAYATEVQHPVEIGADQRQHLVDWLSRRLGTSIKIPSLDGTDFALLGGRLLATEDGLGALIMYETRKGERLILFQCESEEPERTTAFRFAQRGPLAVYYWMEGSFSFAVAGEIDPEQLKKLAKKVYGQVVS